MSYNNLRKFFLAICIVTAGNLFAVAALYDLGTYFCWEAYTQDWMVCNAFLASFLFFVAFYLESAFGRLDVVKQDSCSGMRGITSYEPERRQCTVLRNPLPNEVLMPSSLKEKDKREGRKSGRLVFSKEGAFNGMDLDKLTRKMREVLPDGLEED